MMSSRTDFVLPFDKREIAVAFDAGAVSSDGGLLLLRQVDKRIGLTNRLASCLGSDLRGKRAKHSSAKMLLQRVLGIAMGYEDCNDFDALRDDPMFQLVAGKGPLASQPTLSRFENSVGVRELRAMSGALFELFVEDHRGERVKRIVLDFDATDDPTHGQQELEFYHGYYERHCYLPLLCFASVDGGEQELIAAVLRPGNKHAGHRAASVLRRMVKRLKAAFPKAEIVFRADAGFALPEVYDTCEKLGVRYAISLPKNPRLLSLSRSLLDVAARQHAETTEKVRLFGQIRYATDTWRDKRRVVVKAEAMAKGENPRFVVTNLRGKSPESIYDFYTQRGDVENRIKEMKLDLLSGRTSCHRFLANQFRLLLHAAAYVLMQGLRKLLVGFELASAQVSTLRLKLLKVGTKVQRTTRRVRLHLPTGYPLKETWLTLLARLST
jgi:hypothetical protein